MSYPDRRSPIALRPRLLDTRRDDVAVDDLGTVEVQLSHQAARAGDSITLRYAQTKPWVHIMWGVDSYLERRDGDSWTPAFLLSGMGKDLAVMGYPLPPNLAVPAIGFSGPGPQTFVVPTTAPGGYRFRKEFTLTDPRPRDDSNHWEPMARIIIEAVATLEILTPL